MGFVRAAYVLAVGVWNIQPGEFWAMDLQEWAWLFEVKRPRRTQEWAGNLTDEDVVRLSKTLDEALARGKN